MQALDIALVVGDQAGKQGDIVEVTVPVAPVRAVGRALQDQRAQEVGGAYPDGPVLMRERKIHAPLDRLRAACDLHHRPPVHLGGSRLAGGQVVGHQDVYDTRSAGHTVEGGAAQTGLLEGKSHVPELPHHRRDVRGRCHDVDKDVNIYGRAGLVSGDHRVGLRHEPADEHPRSLRQVFP